MPVCPNEKNLHQSDDSVETVSLDDLAEQVKDLLEELEEIREEILLLGDSLSQIR